MGSRLKDRERERFASPVSIVYFFREVLGRVNTERLNQNRILSDLI